MEDGVTAKMHFEVVVSVSEILASSFTLNGGIMLLFACNKKTESATNC